MDKSQLTPGRELISRERQEQLDKHGYTIDNDVRFNDKHQLAVAAAILLMNTSDYDQYYIESYKDSPPQGWNKDIWHRILMKPYKERVKISGAFCAAELDRVSVLEINEMYN